MFLESFTLWHWFGAALVLGIVDVLVGANFFLLWIGLSAGMVGLLMIFIPAMAWQWQWTVFGICVFASLLVWVQYLKNMPRTSDKPRLNRRSARYIGRVFVLEEPIAQGQGRIRVDDSQWKIIGEDMPVGSKVKVVGVDGVILKVESVDN